VAASAFAFPQEVADIAGFASSGTFAGYPSLIGGVFKYLSNVETRGQKPNVEANLNSRFLRVHPPVQDAIGKAGIPIRNARVSCVFPHGGIQDNSVNRLLLMSSSERHLPSVPLGFFIEGLPSG
jgi:hypothetical protein